MKKTSILPPVRVSPVQLARIQAALDTSGSSLSEFIRDAALKEADRLTSSAPAPAPRAGSKPWNGGHVDYPEACYCQTCRGSDN